MPRHVKEPVHRACHPVGIIPACMIRLTVLAHLISRFAVQTTNVTRRHVHLRTLHAQTLRPCYVGMDCVPKIMGLANAPFRIPTNAPMGYAWQMQPCARRFVTRSKYFVGMDPVLIALQLVLVQHIIQSSAPLLASASRRLVPR